MPRYVPWTSARGLSAHTDRREEFYLDTDVRPIVSRMLQAGYEVLLNKKAWRDPNSDRRDAWSPIAGTRGTKHDIFISQGKSATLTFELLDGFESCPMITAGPFDDVLPRAAWLEGDEIKGEHLRISGSWTRKLKALLIKLGSSLDSLLVQASNCVANQQAGYGEGAVRAPGRITSGELNQT